MTISDDGTPDRLTNGAEIADNFAVSRERVRQLADEGVIPRVAKGKYPFRACMRAYCEWLRDSERRLNKSAAASRVQDRRTRLLDIQIAREEQRLIETDEALAVVDEIVADARARARRGVGGIVGDATAEV